MQTRKLCQQIEKHRGYERLSGFICLPTKGVGTLVGLYTNHTKEYEDFVRKIVKQLAEANRKEKRTIEELVEMIGEEKEFSITLEYVKTFPVEGKFIKPAQKVYLFITEN